MAYIDFAAEAQSKTPIADTLVSVLDRREWEVVRLAQRDGLGSLREPTALARLWGRMFGRDINRRLADPRLEALRRLAVLAWRYGYALPVSAIKEFKAAGFSLDQLEAVLVRIGAARNEPPTRFA